MDLVFSGRPPAFTSSHDQKRLLMKRPAFAHEAEIRRLYLPHEKLPLGDKLSFRIDVNEVFDEITFDPRLAQDVPEREATIRRLGYEGQIVKSDLYQMVFSEILLDE